MSSLDQKIREYGQKRETACLQELVASLDDEELANLIKSKINNSDFTYTWNYILQAFTETADCHGKRFKAVLTLLKALEEKDVSSSRKNTFVHAICVELTKFKSEHLVELCGFCLECIQSKKVTHMGWKDLLPKLLNVLSERETFEHDGLEYTGQEYKSDFINTLCMSSWSPNTITSLTAVFIDMSLTKEEHLKIVSKLLTYLEKMTPQEIPPFVYQLLRFCKHHNSRSIFLKLQNYFGLRIYDNLDKDSPNSESTNFDAIESANNQDTFEAESTVLFHIHTSAALGHNCIKDYLNSLKNLLKTPEFILHPFHLMVLFTISTIPHYEETVFDIIRPAIVRSFTEEQKKLHSNWFREMVPSKCQPEEIFQQVIACSLQDRELVLEALVNFGFALLSVGSGLGRDPIAEKQWHTGSLILLKIIKGKRRVAPTIIQTLSNYIVTRQNATQYIECLYVLSKTLPLLMLDNQSCIVELMESLMEVPSTVANQLLDALIPLTKVSPTIRDHLILLLKKALYSRSTETRQMAVNGFLKLLSNLKVSNMAVLSQSSGSSGSFSSGHSFFTQVSLNRTSQSVGKSSFSNEALCLEVLTTLKRCFMQQAEVRSQLYGGLYDAVCMNPELGIPVLDVIWYHFVDYYVMDDEILPPLNFNKIANLREIDSVLQEPLRKLVFAISLIVNRSLSSEEDRDNGSVVKFVNILDSLCERMSKCELVHFELDDGTDLTDILPESQQKVHILKEAMNVYEALIGYKIITWQQKSENPGQIIKDLFQGYNRLSQFSKNLSKPKKAKKSDQTRTTQSQGNITTIKKPTGQKSSKSFKVPETVLDFQVIEKALKLLHEPDVSFATPAQANVVKTRTDIHRYVMQCALQVIQGVKNYKPIESQYQKVCFDHIANVARILYDRIVRRLKDFIDFDCATAVLAMECFYAIVVLVNGQYKKNLVAFLSKVGGQEKNENLVTHLTPFVEEYQKLFEMDEDEVTDDPEIKKLSFVVINTLALLASQIPSDSNALSVQMFDWLKEYAYNNTLKSKVSTVFINLFFEFHVRYRIGLGIFEQIAIGLGGVTGRISEEEVTQATQSFKVINEATVNNILLALCGNVKSILEDIDGVIARLKSEYCMITYPGEENIEKMKENLKTKEKGVTCHLCFMVQILTEVANITIAPGNISEALFKNIMSLYCTLTSLTKYFLTRSSKTNLAFQGARFERLVKLAGKQLAAVVYKFILHIEESHQQEESQTQTRKKHVDSNVMKSKVLRETRQIPKVIYEIEQFSKSVIQLTNKTKFDLSKYVGQGTVRDFRILQLKEVLEQAGGSATATQSTATQSTVSNFPEPETSIRSGVGEENDEDSDSVSSPPPSKRSKR